MQAQKSKIPETLKKKLLKEEETSQLYSQENMEDLLVEVFEGLSSTILPIAKEEAEERLKKFDNIHEWMGVWQIYGEKTAQQTNLKRNELLEEWGLSHKVYYSSIARYCQNPEFLQYIDRCMEDIKMKAGDAPKDLTNDQYIECVETQLKYWESNKKDLDVILQVPPPTRRRFLEKRGTDYTAKKLGIDDRAINNFMEMNEKKFKTNVDLEGARDKLKNWINNLCGGVGKVSLENIKTLAKQQQEKNGHFSPDVIDRVLVHIFESVIDKLLPLSIEERTERREKFEDPKVWLETFEKYKMKGEEISKENRIKALEEWGLKVEAWDKSLQMYNVQAGRKLEELFMMKKIEAVKTPKPVTKETYGGFLDAQIEYLENKVKELEDLKAPPMLISQRISDFCAIKTGLEVEDIVIFAQANQGVMHEPAITARLQKIDAKMRESVQTFAKNHAAAMNAQEDKKIVQKAA